MFSRIKQSQTPWTVFKVGVTAGLLFIVFRSVALADIRSQLASLQTSRLVLLVIMCWIGQLLCAQRWRLFAASLNIRGSYGSFFKLYFLGMLFNLGLPSLIGGDLVKAYLVGRQTGNSVHAGLASVLQDRAAGLISLMILGMAAGIVCGARWNNVPVWWLYVPLWAGLAMLWLLVWKGRGLYSGRTNPAGASLLHKSLGTLAAFHDKLKAVRLSAMAVTQVIAISFINSALGLWVFHDVTVAVGHPVDFLSFSALVPLITIATMLPISVAGIGVREWSYVQALALLGVPADRALIISLATSALMIAVDLGGVFFLSTAPSGLFAGKKVNFSS